MSVPGPDPLSAPDLPPPVDEPEPAEVQRRARWKRAGSLGALLSLVAALLTLTGSFQALFTGQLQFSDDQRLDLTITGWDLLIEVNGVLEPEANAEGTTANGVPLMVAAAVLFAAAVLGLLVAARPSGPRVGRLISLISVIAAAFLAAMVFAIGMQELWWLDRYDLSAEVSPNAEGDSNIGPGFWTLVAATALAVAAAVVAWRPGQPERDVRAEPEREEPETPPLGVPVPPQGVPVVVHRLPDAPPDEPGP